MNKHFAPLVAFWKQRAPRERAILAMGAGILILALLYSLLIAPVSAQRKHLLQTLPELRADAARFARDVASIKGQTSTAAPADMALLVQSAGLPDAAHVASPDNKHASLSGKGLPWANVAQLLADARSQGWTLAKLSVKSPDGGGMVDITAEWAR
jgi:type II secretory pathway component PulM